MDIQQWLDEEASKLGEAISLFESAGKYQVGMHIVDLDIEDGHRLGRLSIKDPNTTYVYEFDIQDLDYKTKAGSNLSEHRVLPVAVGRFDKVKRTEESIFKWEGGADYYYRLCHLSPNEEEAILFYLYWSIPEGALVNLGIDDLATGSFASYRGFGLGWNREENDEHTVPPGLSFSRPDLNLPDSIEGREEIMDIKIPWKLTDVSVKAAEIMSGFDFEAFVQTVKTGPIVPIEEPNLE